MVKDCMTYINQIKKSIKFSRKKIAEYFLAEIKKYLIKKIIN